jgi:hypothetical protein
MLSVMTEPACKWGNYLEKLEGLWYWIYVRLSTVQIWDFRPDRISSDEPWVRLEGGFIT